MSVKTEAVFEQMDPEARVWIYQANRALRSGEIERVQADLDRFCAQWKAHGTPLAAKGSVLYNRFVVLVVDEKAEPASGCSIDTSVHMIQKTGEIFGVDFFDRLQVVYVDENNNLKSFHSSEAKDLLAEGKIAKDTIVFNNMVLKAGELKENWHIPLEASWLKRYL